MPSKKTDDSFYEEVDMSRRGDPEGLDCYYTNPEDIDKDIPISRNDARLLRIEHLAEVATHKLETVNEIRSLLLKANSEQKRKNRVILFLLITLFSLSFIATICTWSADKATSIVPSSLNAPEDRDCTDAFERGSRPAMPSEAVYAVLLPGSFAPTLVKCDMEVRGGGWTVIQRRGRYGNPRDYFDRRFEDYKSGFGDLDGEFWLGLEAISRLFGIKGRDFELLIRLTPVEENEAILEAAYESARIEKAPFYNLTVSGHSGSSGDALGPFNGAAFSTIDRDQDRDGDGNCARRYRSGWWFSNCGSSNLNGLNYDRKRAPYVTMGVAWEDDMHKRTYSYSASEIMIRSKKD